MPGASWIFPKSPFLYHWCQYSFYFTFYSILKPSYFLVIILPHDLAPGPPSTPNPLTSSRGTALLSIPLAQQPHCLLSPLSFIFLNSYYFIWQMFKLKREHRDWFLTSPRGLCTRCEVGYPLSWERGNFYYHLWHLGGLGELWGELQIHLLSWMEFSRQHIPISYYKSLYRLQKPVPGKFLVILGVTAQWKLCERKDAVGLFTTLSPAGT